ncbi:MAG: hypothetical protein NWQ19_08400 [Nonlabens sp.]|nr:hypothetical protein [Nonlabens sp.]
MSFKPYQIFIAVLFFLTSTNVLKAHSPSQAGTLFYQVDDYNWTIQVSSALAAFEYEVHNKYGVDSYKTPEEFNELVIKLVSENIAIRFNNGSLMELSSPVVTLGHETKVLFQVGNTPKSFTSLAFKNSCFKNLYKNQNVLLIVKKDGVKDKFTLESNNDFSVIATLENNKFTALEGTGSNNVSQKESRANIWIYGFFGTLVVALLGFLFFTLNKNKTV